MKIFPHIMYFRRKKKNRGWVQIETQQPKLTKPLHNNQNQITSHQKLQLNYFTETNRKHRGEPSYQNQKRQTLKLYLKIKHGDLESRLPAQSSNSFIKSLKHSPGQQLLGINRTSLLLNHGLSSFPPQYNWNGLLWGYLSINLLFPLFFLPLFQLLQV